MRDSFHRQIRDALERKGFDPLVFERCMCDILRDPFPGLVPITGGSDAGMDGAIADGQGEAFPLVCTTAEDVIGNLTGSLDSYLKKGGRRRQVVLATSLTLTPSRRRRLEARAREKGFRLIQVFEREGITDRLYESERWCRELLGLEWRPQALSPTPPPGRARLEIELTGRDADVEWLKTTEGDRLITGQPGSGKTHLLHHLTRKGWGVFLRSDDPVAIRGALLEQQPNVVIVDDAHADPGRIDILRSLRQDMEQDFAIVATCWEGERDTIAEALESLPANRIRRLELLTRDQIVEVIRQAGVQAREDFLRFLVTQAANKPGLAVTLATLCLRGAWVEVLRGDALARSLMTDFKELVGPESPEFLATLGIGGQRGMSIEAARNLLGFDRLKARKLAIGLATGGVLAEVGEGVLSVSPEALRSALIRQVFFEGPARLDYRPLLSHAPSFESSVAAIVTARGYGAEIPDEELRGLVEQCSVPEEWQVAFRRTLDVWGRYAALGEAEARWALEHYQGDVMHIADEVLWQAPRAAIPRLLERVAVDDGASRSLDLLRAWMEDLAAEEHEPGAVLARRKLSVRLARRHYEGGGSRQVVVRVLFMALTPKVESTGRDPGMGRTITTRQGLLPVEQLRGIAAIWGEGRGAIDRIDSETWSLVKDASWGWAYPESVAPGIAVEQQTRDAIQDIGRRVLEDLSTLVEGGSGLATGFVRLAKRLGLELQLPIDPTFELLYPSDEVQGLRDEKKEAAGQDALEELASRWEADLMPEEVARELLRYEGEAEEIQQKWPRRSPDFCQLLAGKVQDPARWAEVFLDHQLASDLLRPFLEAVVAARPAGWDGLLARCLGLDSQAWLAVRLVLQSSQTPPDLLEAALARATDFPQLVEALCQRQEVSPMILQALLHHRDTRTALAAALGEWMSNPKHQVAESIQGAWRRAILRSASASEIVGRDSFDYWLSAILASDPELACEWTLAFIAANPDPSSVARGAVSAATKALLEEHRLMILEGLEPGRLARSLVPLIVGREVAVYGRLLEIERLEDHHLEPLAGKPDAEWAELAQLALAKDRDPRVVANASFQGTLSGDGYSDGQRYFSQWERAFAELESHPDEDLRTVARRGLELAQADIRRSAARQAELEREGF